MIDLITRNEVIECATGFYSPNTQEFYIVEPFLGVRSGSEFLTFIHKRQLHRYKILKVFKPQDLEDALSVYNKDKNL